MNSRVEALGLLLSMAMSSAACGGPGGELDAGADTAPPDAPPDAGPALPASALLPDLGPCPAGYRAFDADGAAACDPWPEAGRALCSRGEAHFPGTPGCAPVGPPCPADGFPTDLPGGPVLFVAEGATGGTGSRAEPFGTVAEALGGAAAGDVIAIGVGTYRERITLPSGVAVVGACASGVTIRGADVAGTGASLRYVTLGGGTGAGVLAGAGAGVDLEGVVLDGATSSGIDVRGGTVSGREVLITDVHSTDVSDGMGIAVYGGGSVELDGLVIARARGAAVYVTGVGTGSIATIRDASLFDIQPDTDGDAGEALLVAGFGAAVFERVVVEDVQTVGIVAFDSASITLTDVIVRRVRPRTSDAALGRGLSALDGATIAATRLLVEGVYDVGVFAEGEVRLRDAIIRDMKSDAVDGGGGRCINVQNGGTASLDQVLLVRCRDVALLSHGESTRVEVSDLTLLDTLDPEFDARGGWGAGVQAGAALSVNRLHIEDSRSMGLYANGRGTTVDARDVTVLDTASDTASGTRGRGVSIQRQADATFERLRIEGSHEAGMIALGSLTRIAATDVIIRGTNRSACTSDGCESNASNLTSFDDAAIDVSRFVFEDSEICGVWLDQGGTLDLRQGNIRGNTIGACIIDDDFDLDRISDQVRYHDNTTNLDSPTLPVPQPVEPLPI